MFTCRVVIAALLVIATSATVANLLITGRNYQIAAVVATALALFSFAVYAVLGLEARLFAHRSFAHRLWLMSERYRSLLAEVQEGMVSMELRGEVEKVGSDPSATRWLDQTSDLK